MTSRTVFQIILDFFSITLQCNVFMSTLSQHCYLWTHFSTSVNFLHISDIALISIKKTCQASLQIIGACKTSLWLTLLLYLCNWVNRVCVCGSCWADWSIWFSSLRGARFWRSVFINNILCVSNITRSMLFKHCFQLFFLCFKCSDFSF